MASKVNADEEFNLETLLAKATNPLDHLPDPQSLSRFCEVVDKDRDGPQTALRLLAHKIQSPLEKESLMALVVLEECVKSCGSKFRSEIGKFRFLNEMIKVVSPKYLGNRASVKVKQKIVELMYLWSIELKQEVKIFEAYQMLRRQGVVLEDPIYVIKDYEPPPPPAPRPKNAVFDDEEKSKQLQLLLSSNRPEDLQAANRLIKNMVKEADRRMDLLAKRSTELETVHNNANVLADMLDHFNASTSLEEKELMKELFESCERLRPKLFRLAGEMDEKDEGLCDILKANDELTIVISRYRKAMGLTDIIPDSISDTGKSNENGTALLDLASPEKPCPSTVTDSSLLDDQLLVLGFNESLDVIKPTQVSGAPSNSFSSSISDLDKIFGVGDSIGDPPIPAILPSLPPSMSSSIIDSKISNFQNISSKAQTTSKKSKGLEELDEIGQSLLRQSMPLVTPIKVESLSTPQKIPLSQLKEKKQQLEASNEMAEKRSCNSSGALLSSERTVAPQSPMHEVLPLNDIFVPLETIQPSTLPPLTLFEKNDLTIVMHFGLVSPRPDVSVMVISTMSKNTSPVRNVSFQAAVPKSMKVKLQPPSASVLPPHNPILPPAAITQVMLLANPQKEKVRLKYKVCYNLNNEDFIEVGEVDDLTATR